MEGGWPQLPPHNLIPSLSSPCFAAGVEAKLLWSGVAPVMVDLLIRTTITCCGKRSVVYKEAEGLARSFFFLHIFVKFPCPP